MAQIYGFVNPGVRDGTRQVSLITTSKRLTPTVGTESSTTYVNQVVGAHNRSALLKYAGVPPFKALPYRVFAGSFTSAPYDFTYELPGTTWRQWGQTPVSASVGSGIPVYWGTRLSGGLRVPDVSLNMENQAITEALNKLQDQKMNLLVSIAEAGESIDFIATTVSRIIRSYRAARRGRWSQAASILAGIGPRTSRAKAVAKGWLAYHYAVLPLLGDIQGAFQLAYQGLKDTPVIVGRRFVSSPYGLPSKPAHYQSATWRIGGSCEIGVEAKFTAKLTDPVINLLGQMGLYNPFSVAWELVPFSFVIDWLIPIGNALEALTATLGLAYHDAYVNWKVVTNLQWTGCNRVDPIGILPSATIKNVCQWRKTYLTFPLPRLYLKSPFSTSQVMSAIALIAVLRR